MDTGNLSTTKSRKSARYFLLLALLLLVVAILGASRVELIRAATAVTDNSFEDEPDADGDLSLDEAMQPASGVFDRFVTPTGSQYTANLQAASPQALPAGATADWWTAVQEQVSQNINSQGLSDGSANWSATGEANSSFGISVATAGDVNGDGYADVIVGASGYASNRGRATVYTGTSAGLSTTPAVTLTGEAGNDYFGFSVATAGDVNGDGYDDFVVGAYGYGSARGRAYVYHGSGSGLSATPALTLTGEATNNYFGQSVATAGDINGDGYADLVVGAWFYNGYQGRAYVYHGSASGLSATPSLTLTGEAGSAFGIAVATAGDVDGDGYTDLAVGAEGYNSDTGRVTVYRGSASGLSATPVLSLTGEAASNWFGGSVATAGDVDGDGYADLVVGARGYNGNTGRAYVYHGSGGGLSATPALSLTGETAGDNFGRSVSAAGDVDGDGYADLVVGAFGYSSETGRAYVYHGSVVGLSTTPAFTLTGEASSAFGYSVATAGDVDGDGYADVVVGAPGYNSSQGRAYAFHGAAAAPSASPAVTLTGEAANNHFGNPVATAGDVNGDGYADLVVGANGYNGYTGQVYAYHGSASGPYATPAITLTGETAYSFFGDSVSTAGDVNGDGYTDLVVGASNYGSGRGRAYVYHGSAVGLSATPALTLSGEIFSHFGYSVASAGDVNGDGYADLVIGATLYSSNRGRAYVYHGAAGGLSATPALTLTGEAASNRFGWSVATAGDVDGDGYADLVVGAWGFDSGRGRAYIYHGSASGLSATPALTLTGEAANDYFGDSVATAGDVNGDGYADLVVGAESYDSNTGRAYIYHGSASGLSATPALTLTGEAANNYFGLSVATAGDVNGDGYADLVVGAPLADPAYLYHGSPAGLNPTPVLTLTGEAISDWFGISVATAGDVDGDGYADLVVGASGYLTNTGRAYVYPGNGGWGRTVLTRQGASGSWQPVQPWGYLASQKVFR